MTLTELVVIAIIGYAALAFGVRRLGWPTDMKTAARWGIMLFALWILAGTAMNAAISTASGLDVPFSASDVLFVLALVLLGLFGRWRFARTRERSERLAERAERARSLPRRRALPPPPAPDDNSGAAP